MLDNIILFARFGVVR